MTILLTINELLEKIKTIVFKYYLNNLQQKTFITKVKTETKNL